MKRLFLIGYMGAGKTTLGTLLASKTELQFIDLDHYIESRYQKTIGNIFEEEGEMRFREIESAMLKEIADIENVVVSTGGGAPCFYDNMELMNCKGVTIYLQALPETLAKRLITCKSKRPLIKDKNEDELIEFIKEGLARRELYYNKSDIVFRTEEFETQKDAENIVNDLIGILNKDHKNIHL